TGRIEATLFAQEAERCRDKLVNGNILVIQGEVDHDAFSGGLRLKARFVLDLMEARIEMAKSVQIKIQAEQVQEGIIEKIKTLLSPAKTTEQGCQVVIEYIT